MTLLQAIVLGIVQGLTEFFPVSSSGHLVLCQALFGFRESALEFDIFLHCGTLAAVVAFFWRDLGALFTTGRRMLWLIVIASVPTGIIGFFFKDAIEALFGSPRAVGIMLMVTGMWLIAASAFAGRSARHNRRGEIGVPGALAVGIAQGIAVIPGISRSGATIGTGLLAGWGKDAAFTFAFLLSIPAVGGATLLKARKIAAALTGGEAAVFLAGAAAAAVTGFAAIALLRRLIRGDKLYVFGIYCIIIGGICMAVIGPGR